MVWVHRYTGTGTTVAVHFRMISRCCVWSYWFSLLIFRAEINFFCLLIFRKKKEGGLGSPETWLHQRPVHQWPLCHWILNCDTEFPSSLTDIVGSMWVKLVSADRSVRYSQSLNQTAAFTCRDNCHEKKILPSPGKCVS